MALQTTTPYRSAAGFVETVAAIADHLAALNAAQSELEFSFDPGVRVRAIDYADSGALARYAKQDGVLARLIDAALADCPKRIDFLAVMVTSAESLLTAMIAVGLLRRRHPRMHVCLADHGYENFSLHAHMDGLRAAGTLDTIFDTIIEAKDDRDSVAPALMDAVAANSAPRGFITARSLSCSPAISIEAHHPPRPPPTFTPSPVLFTRLSKRRCYWSRCAFCAQNIKYDDPKTPSRAEIPATLDRLAAYLEAGYETLIFSDEAVSPAYLRRLCNGIAQRGLRFRWACRCRLELAYTREFFQNMRAAGCYEILFGLETTSPRIQRLMDKHVDGLDEDRVSRMFEDMAAVGLGLHVTLIGGFPSDTLAETERTVDFLIRSLRRMNNATFYLNAFSLFPDTRMFNDPSRFGIAEVHASGDMPSSYAFSLAPEIREQTEQARREIPRLRKKLEDELGWSDFGAEAAARAARSLYFTTGCGAIFKTQEVNPFANPLRPTA